MKKVVKKQKSAKLRLVDATEEDLNIKTLDEFDLLQEMDFSRDFCAMCKGNHLQGVEMVKDALALRKKEREEEEDVEEAHNISARSCVLDLEGVWVSRYSLVGKHRLFVHYCCAFYSPMSRFDGEKWYNVRREVVRSRALACHICKQKGATVGCMMSRCHVVVHVPCAMKSGLIKIQLEIVSPFYCRAHAREREEAERKMEAKKNCLSDVSHGREPIAVSVVKGASGGTPLGFEYFTHNVDSDDVSAASYPLVSAIDCCDCTGLCNDVEVCSCLRAQRNYSNQGFLLADPAKPIFECNLRCACSVRRCTNRVVEKGLRYQFQCFPKHDNTWGVRSLEHIPGGNFVCEVTGQYTLGGSSVSHFDRASELQTTLSCTEIAKLREQSKEWREVASLGLVLPVLTWEDTILDPKNPNKGNPMLDVFAWGRQRLRKYGDEMTSTERTEMSSSSNATSEPSDAEIEAYLNGQLCLDTRFFGNIGRFLLIDMLRRRQNNMQRGLLLSQLLATTNASLASQRPMEPPLHQSNLTRRLVYNNMADMRYPKLALFAARDIAAFEELVL